MSYREVRPLRASHRAALRLVRDGAVDLHAVAIRLDVCSRREVAPPAAARVMHRGPEQRTKRGPDDERVQQQPRKARTGEEDPEQEREQPSHQRSLAGAEQRRAPAGHPPGHLLHRAETTTHDRAALDGESLVGEPVHRLLGITVVRVRRDGVLRL
jgi:hypothetical protein